MLLRRKLFLLLCALVCLYAAIALVVSAGLPERADYSGLGFSGEYPIAPEVNAIAPPFDAPTLQGHTLHLLDLRGQPVIVNFWATWCEPCRVEMPELEAFYEAEKARGLRLVAVNLGESPEQVRAWTQSLGLTFDIVLDQNQAIAALYQLRGQPSTYVISPEGLITHIFYGPITADTLRAITPFQ